MASTDTLDENTAFAQTHGANFPILSDPEKSLWRAYGVLGFGGYSRRWTFYIDQDGIIAKIDKSVKPQTAGEDIVTQLKALGW